jgi:hypothetical protein
MSGGSAANFRSTTRPARAGVDTGDLDGDSNTTEVFIGPNTAALDLGIFGENDLAEDTDNDIPDTEIEGGQLGGVDPLDRLFVRVPGELHRSPRPVQRRGRGRGYRRRPSPTTHQRRAHVRLRWPRGAAAAVTGTVSGLCRRMPPDFDPEDDDKITLRDLIDNIDDLGSFLVGPTSTAAARSTSRSPVAGAAVADHPGPDPTSTSRSPASPRCSTAAATAIRASPSPPRTSRIWRTRQTVADITPCGAGGFLSQFEIRFLNQDIR